MHRVEEKNAAIFAQWLVESGKPEGPMLLMDHHCYRLREELWAAGPGIEPGLSEWAFIPHTEDGCGFYRVVPKP
jgi:hypothetical protein